MYVVPWVFQKLSSTGCSFENNRATAHRVRGLGVCRKLSSTRCSFENNTTTTHRVRGLGVCRNCHHLSIDAVQKRYWLSLMRFGSGKECSGKRGYKHNLKPVLLTSKIINRSAFWNMFAGWVCPTVHVYGRYDFCGGGARLAKPAPFRLLFAA